MSISTSLFKRSRGRESGTSARGSIRRAGGGISLMARNRSSRRGAGRFLPRSRPLATRREDRLSALSDDLLLLILRRIGTPTALRAGALSRRWAHLPRELPALDLSAGDILPPRYHQLVRLYRDLCSKRLILMYGDFKPIINRYERRAMRSFAGSVQSFLEGPQRKVDRLKLEFFTTGNASCMNQLLAEAIDTWGVCDLEVVAKPMYKQRDVHTFPSHGLCKEPWVSRLQSLKLGRCVPPLLHGYRALTMLVLRDIPASPTPAAAYEAIFTSCLQLNTLHLVSCDCRDTNVLVDAPGSKIRELVVDNCLFGCLRMKALPCLESLASLRSQVLFESASFPCLRQWNLTKETGFTMEPYRRQFAPRLKLGMFFPYTLDITSLIVRFTGPDRWIVPSSSTSSFLPNLRKLLVADVPSSWDVTWTYLLLEMAPSLEVLHIHIVPCGENPGEEISWHPTKLRLNHLKEFVVAGFEGTARQIDLVKFVVGVCTALRHVAMFRNGHARDIGHWNWEMVTEQHPWTYEEKENTLMQIIDGVSSLTPQVDLVLG